MKQPRVSNADIERRAKQFLPSKKDNEEICLVIDGMNLAYMSYYAYAGLSYKGRGTSIIFGMPNYISSVIRRYNPAKVIVCWDGAKHPERIKALPGYKEHRESTKDRQDKKKRKAFLKQIDRTRILLKHMGITQANNPNMEGDDMIYWITRKMKSLYNVVIVSGDKDMHQLIDYNVSVYCPRTRTPYTTFAFLVDHNVEISQYTEYLILVGDKSDDIPGYRGIGPVRATKFFQQYKSIQSYLDNPNAEFSGISDKDELEIVYKRNKLMIDLKHFNYIHHKISDITYYKNKRSPSFNELKYNAFCLKYNLKTLLTDTFKNQFKKISE